MKKIIYILIFVCGMSISSCSDWLDILPKNEQVTADYWKTKEDVEAVIASGYYYMRTTTQSLITWGEFRGGSLMTILIGDEGKLQNFQLTADLAPCNWSKFYQVINMANSVIDYAPKVLEIDETYTEAAMKSHQTEAYFMRALMYFYLVRNFRDAPLVLTAYVDDTAPYNIEKSDANTIIGQIKSDIKNALYTEAAKEFFDDDRWSGASKGRATKWALYALMADVCLWSEDYDECIKYADLLIKATSSKRPAFMTVPEQWFSIFNPGNSNESIFELNWDASTYAQTENSPSGFFYVGDGTALSAYQYSPAMIERLLMDGDVSNLLSGSNPVRSLFGAYVSAGGTTTAEATFYVWKYHGTEIQDITAVRTTNDANFIIYRMADVMLMKAEALIWKGGITAWDEALGIINQIRTRSNLKLLEVNLEETTEEVMLDYVLYERDIELAAEGKRWYDLLRLGKTKDFRYKNKFIETVVENNATVSASWIRSVLKSEDAWYLPIYEKEIENNTLLVQNPYYAPTTTK